MPSTIRSGILIYYIKTLQGCLIYPTSSKRSRDELEDRIIYLQIIEIIVSLVISRRRLFYLPLINTNLLEPHYGIASFRGL
jgi:hypothetical protein